MNSVRSIATVIILTATLGLAAYTNPSTEDFSGYVRRMVIEGSQKELKDPLWKLFTPLLGSITAGVVGSQTVRTDYVFFSIYEFPFMKERFKALGIFRNFILLEKPDLGG